MKQLIQWHFETLFDHRSGFRMRSISTGLIVLAIIAFQFTTTVNGQSEVLKWKLKKGDQFEVQLDQAFSSFTKIDSRETKVDNSTTIGISWDVTAVNADGEATVSQAIESIKLAVSNPAVPSQALKFDTAADENVADEYSKSSKAMLKEIKPLIGLKFDVVMAATGEIKSVLLPKATADVVDQLPGTVRLRSLFSETGLKDVLGASAIVLPTDPLEKGGSWTEEKDVETAFGKFVRSRTYSLVGPRNVDGVELMEIQIDPAMTAKNALEQKGDSLRGKMVSYSGSGTLLLDAAGGYFRSSAFKNELKTEKPYREKTIKTTVTTEVGMTVTKK